MKNAPTFPDPTSPASPARPCAVIRTSEDDFRVEEVPLYAPSGAGEHVYVTFEKRGMTTFDAVASLARALGVHPRDAGTAGLKDRHAVTVQTASFALPLGRDLPELGTLDNDRLRVISVARHGNKLRTGHLRGNRFSLVLREIDPGAVAPLAEALRALAVTGLPNYFGEQRFGRGGDNAEVALSWMRGRSKPPREPRVRRLQFSALQSSLFHRVLDRRVADGTWSQPLPGDLVEPREGGGLRPVPLEGGDELATTTRADVAPTDGDRVAAVPTGPMYGIKMRWPAGVSGELERQVLAEALGDGELLRQWAVLGEGTRRPLGLWPSALAVSEVDAAACSLRVDFVLPRGAYATSVLAVVCDVHDAARRRPPAGPSEGSGRGHEGEQEEAT